jgi:chorismate-pyruvate lyase
MIKVRLIYKWFKINNFYQDLSTISQYTEQLSELLETEKQVANLIKIAFEKEFEVKVIHFKYDYFL